MTTPEPEAPAPTVTVLYDGACPLCRREIGLYQGLPPTTPVCFADVNDASLPLPAGATREQLLARFHVRGRMANWSAGRRPSSRCGRSCPVGAGWRERVACRARHG